MGTCKPSNDNCATWRVTVYVPVNLAFVWFKPKKMSLGYEF